MIPLIDQTTLLVLAIGLYAVGLGFFLTRSNGPKRSLASQIKLLRRVPFLAALEDVQLEKIATLVRELRVPQDAYVIREFRFGEAMYILVSGNLHILKKGAVDETLIQAMGPGEVVGEMALLTGGRRVASVKSTTSCILLQIDRDDFEEFLATQPEISRAVWQACEVHSINLMLADHEKTRSLTLDKRKLWIQNRQSRFIHAGEKITIDELGYAALVAGTIVHKGATLSPPALFLVQPQEELMVVTSGRLCLLKAIQPLASTGTAINQAVA